MPPKPRKNRSVREKKESSLDDPPFISKWSFGWVPFPYQSEYLGETQILTHIQNNNLHFENHTFFQVFDWSCELLQEGKNWVVKSNGKIVLRRCILSSHKCKECSKVYFLPWPFKDWFDPEQANYCHTCRNTSDKNEISNSQESSSRPEPRKERSSYLPIEFNSITVEK